MPTKPEPLAVKPIRTESDYRSALAAIDALMDARAGTPEADRLEVLSILVEAYEDEHAPFDLPDPIEAIKHWMEAQGLTRRDLEGVLGSRARVAEILNRKRPLTLNMIRRLSSVSKIPAAVLIAKPSESRSRRSGN